MWFYVVCGCLEWVREIFSNLPKIRQLKIAKKNLVEFDFKISLIVARDQKLKHKRLKQSCRGQWLNS